MTSEQTNRDKTDRSIGYGIIGTGMMGVEHIHNVNAIAGAHVAALADPTSTSLATGVEAASQGRRVGSNGGAVSEFADHQDLLGHPGVEAVVIASPNHTHRDILADVFRSGQHVLIEKPMCTTVADCQDVMAMVAGTADRFPDRIVQVGLEYRYMPAVDKLVSEVKAGAVGRPLMVAIREHRFPFLQKVDNWNRFSENTGGTLVEKCCHFFDLMNLLLDERPTRVMASGAQDVNHLNENYDGRAPDILDNAYVVVDYPSGARAMLDLCMFAEATFSQEEVSVVGNQGKVEAFLPQGVFRRGSRGEHRIGAVSEEVVDDSHIAYQGLHHGSSYVEHLAFLAAIAGQAPVPITVEDGLWSVAIGAAAHRSIDEGRPVQISEMMGSGDLGSGDTAPVKAPVGAAGIGATAGEVAR